MRMKDSGRPANFNVSTLKALFCISIAAAGQNRISIVSDVDCRQYQRYQRKSQKKKSTTMPRNKGCAYNIFA